MDPSGALAANSSLLEIGQGAPSGLGGTHLLDIHEVDGRDKVLRLPGRRNLRVQLVDLLKGKTFGFVDVEMDERHADAAEAAPDEEDFGAKVAFFMLVIRGPERQNRSTHALPLPGLTRYGVE